VSRSLALAALIGVGCGGALAPRPDAATGAIGASGGAAGGWSTGVAGAGGGIPAIRWPGNAADCPSERPTGAFDSRSASADSICAVAEGQSCAWWFVNESAQTFSACTCYEQNSSVRRWLCEGAYPVPSECPHEQPASGERCAAPVSGCPFPLRTRCSCAAGAWSCITTVDGAEVPPPPATIDLARPISALTDVEALSWCEWFSSRGRLMGPYPPEAPVSDDGYTAGVGGIAWPAFFADACLPDPAQVAPSQCAANLKSQPCAATLGELTDCVITLEQQVAYGHGCGRFFEHPDCDGTIVRHLDPFGEPPAVNEPMGCFSLRVW